MPNIKDHTMTSIIPQATSSAKALSAGTTAPDFRLPSTPDQLVSLREFRGQPVILAFYPADWSPVCGRWRSRRRPPTKAKVKNFDQGELIR